MMRVNVIHIITTLDPGGAENQLLLLVAEQVKLGLQVSVIYLKGSGNLKKEFLKVGAKVEDKISNHNTFIQIFMLRKYCKNSNPIVHLHLPQAELTWFFTFRRAFTVVSRHSGGQFYSKVPKFISSLLSNLALVRCNTCIAISKHVFDYLIESKEIRNHKKLVIVEYGFSKDFFFSNMAGKKDIELENTSNKIILGCIARLSPEKNHFLIFDAVKQLLRQGYTPILFLAGEGGFKKDLEKEIEILQVQNNVIFLGKIENVKQFIESMDIVILASKFEGFGMVILECVASNKLIFASNNSAMKEILEKEAPEQLFNTSVELTQKIMNYRSFLESPTFNQNYLNMLKKYDSTKMAMKINQIYLDFLIKSK